MKIPPALIISNGTIELNKKVDIKKAGFMRPASTFSNIQLSNSREVILIFRLQLTETQAGA